MFKLFRFHVIKNSFLGILDPRVIGDKPRWYSHYVQPFYFQVHNPHSPLGYDLYEDSDSDADGEFTEIPNTIEEVEEEAHEHDFEEIDENDCSCCSSLDDSDDELFSIIRSRGGSSKRQSKDSMNCKVDFNNLFYTADCESTEKFENMFANLDWLS